MRLPFSHDPFLAVFAAYNPAWWPVAAALWLFTLIGFVGLTSGRAIVGSSAAAVLGMAE